MKTLFIPAKSKSTVNKNKILDISKKLPKNLAIAYSIQFQEIANEIKTLLSSSHNITSCIQVLGCSKIQTPKQTQAILLITQARFHATGLAINTNLPIYTIEHDTFSKVSEQEMRQFEKRQKISYLKFLNADNVGVIVSTKLGQQNLKKALELKNKLKDKNTYLYMGNDISTQEFENFPQIQCWVNTACPRLDMDSNIVNVDKI